MASAEWETPSSVAAKAPTAGKAIPARAAAPVMICRRVVPIDSSDTRLPSFIVYLLEICFSPDSRGLQLQQKNTKAKYVPDNIFRAAATLKAYLWRDKIQEQLMP